MGIKERIVNSFIELRQHFMQEALIDENGVVIPVNWVKRDDQLVAFFPSDRIDFTRSIEGVSARSLANAYVSGFVKAEDTLLVSYARQPNFLKVTYAHYMGMRSWVHYFGDRNLHILRPVGELKPGITYGGKITYWRKIEEGGNATG